MARVYTVTPSSPTLKVMALPEAAELVQAVEEQASYNIDRGLGRLLGKRIMDACHRLTQAKFRARVLLGNPVEKGESKK